METDPLSDSSSSETESGPLNLRRRVLRSVGWLALEKWGGRTTSLVAFALLGRLLSPTDFGVVALAAVFLAFCTVFVDSGFAQALVQRKKLDEIHATTAFWISLILAGVVALLLCVAAPLIDALIAGESLALVIQVMALNVPLVALSSVPAAILQRNLQFGVLSIRRLLSVLGGAVAAIVLAMQGAGVWALVAQSIVTNVIGVLVLWGASSWRPRLAFSKDAAADMWSLGSAVLGIELLALTNTQADKFLVGTFAGPTALGYYFVGSRIIQILLDMLTAVTGSLSLPTFARLQGDPKRVMRALEQFTFVSAILAFPSFAIAAISAPYIIPVVFGTQWTASVVIMQWFAAAAALTSIAWFHKGLLIAVGKPRSALWILLGQTVAGLVLVGVALPFGLVAVAASRVLPLILLWPFRLVALHRHAHIDIVRYLKQLRAPTVSAILAVGTVAGLEGADWLFPGDVELRALTLVGSGALAYIAVLAITARREIAGLLAKSKQGHLADEHGAVEA